MVLNLKLQFQLYSNLLIFTISNCVDCTEDNQMSATENFTSTTEPIDASTLASFIGSTQQPNDFADFTLEPTEGTESATDFETTTPTTTPLPRLSRRKRHINFPGSSSGDNNAYTMEVMVAVDRKMHEYHGNNIQAYVLTLMSIVSNIYADASIGNSINVAVVHIFYLRDDLHIESNHNGKCFGFHIINPMTEIE